MAARVEPPRREPKPGTPGNRAGLRDDPSGTGSDPARPRGYFDAASSEPLHPAARDVLLAAVDEGWADPARLYRSARRARLLLDNAREIVAAVIGARTDEVMFTSSGTQAVHLGILGSSMAWDGGPSQGGPSQGGPGHGPGHGGNPGRREILVSAVEHSSVLQAASYLAAQTRSPDQPGTAGAPRTPGIGASAAARTPVTTVRRVGVDRYGMVDPAEFSQSLGAETALACLQAANHEVGTIQPVSEVASACQEHGVPLLVDAAQAVARVEVPAGWSLLTASAHKWGGPAGVGVLAIRKGVRWRSPMPEDERENGRVPGFENVPGVLAAAAALRARTEEAAALAASHTSLVDHIRRRVPELMSDVDVVGHPTIRLPHLVTFSCLYVDGEALVTGLDRAGFAVSSGSSCTSSTLRPSHVLEAMGVLTHGNVRVSLTSGATRADVDRFLAAATDVVTTLRREVRDL